LSAYFEMRDVSVRYDKVRALRQVSLQLEPGQIVALIGTNGAGKTTSLRAITGLAPLAAGEIHFDGRRIDRTRPERIVAQGVAMVPEGRHVYPYMSVRDNLLMGAYLRTDKAAIRADLDRVFARFPRLKERIRQHAGTLSGGEQQMVAMSRALMARPKLLLLDEPSLGLAPLLVREIARDHDDQPGRPGERHSGRAELADGAADLVPRLCARDRPGGALRPLGRAGRQRPRPPPLPRRLTVGGARPAKRRSPVWA